jgi:hypothetical protein
MNPVEVFKLMFIMLPVWILEEGFKMLNNFLKDKKDGWDNFLFLLAGALCIITLGLILDGHPLR